MPHPARPSAFAFARRCRRPDARRAAGFSLIESMVALLVSGLLMLASLPFTQSWIASTRVRDTQGLLQQGVARAKAIALRNPGGSSGSAAAAILCVGNGRLRLIAATRSPQTAASCTATTALWSAALQPDTSITSGDNALACLAFNNRGVSINPAAAAGTDSCATSTSVLISAASQNATVTFY